MMTEVIMNICISITNDIFMATIKFTSHDLPGHSEIHQGLSPYGSGFSYATAVCECVCVCVCVYLYHR